jgi:zinc protease
MKNKLFLLLTFLFITQGKLMATKLNTIQYKNKTIPIIFQKNNQLPIFNLQLVFKNSGYINDNETPGLTNIAAKILNEGTLKDGAIEFSKKLENNAIEIYTTTGFETFVIEVSCLKEKYPLAIKYLKKILKNPNTSLESLNKIKKIQISKLAQKENDFDFIASNQLKTIAYNNTAFQNNVLGTQESIEHINIKNIKNKLNNILDINNLIIVGGGDIEYDDFKSQINSILKLLQDDNKNKLKKINIANEVTTKTINKDTQQSYIYFIAPFNIDINSKEHYKAKLASFILGESGFGSRLMEEIRVKNGLAYSAYAYIINKKSHAHFSGYLQTKLNNTIKAKNMVQYIVEDFVKNGVSQEELTSAKQFIIGSEPLKTETFSQNLNRLFSLYYRDLDFDYTQKELQLIQDITLDDLNNYIKEHKEIQKLSFSILTK